MPSEPSTSGDPRRGSFDPSGAVARSLDVSSGIGTLGAPSWLRHSTYPLQRFLRLSPDEASFRTRKFHSAVPSKQLALELAGKTFIGGYNAALAAGRAEDVLQHVHCVAPDLRGFAVEGAAMGSAIADILPFRTWSFARHLQTFERDFSYLNHVGAGWALARLPWRHEKILALLDPVHHWLACDGLGFHDTFFHHRRILAGRRRQAAAYAARAYDQGVGRALWFVAGGCVASATGLICNFPETRQGDLWSGLGLAIAYAGPTDEADLSLARRNSGGHRTHFGQGVAFACEARIRARHIPMHTDMAARVLTGIGAAELSALVREARNSLPADAANVPAYEIWRRRVANATSPMLERQR
jgi:hypothetical protein